MPILSESQGGPDALSAFFRPGVEKQAEKIAVRRQEETRKKLLQHLEGMRKQAEQAQHLLSAAKPCCGSGGGHYDLSSPGSDTAMTRSWHGKLHRYALRVLSITIACLCC